MAEWGAWSYSNIKAHLSQTWLDWDWDWACQYLSQLSIKTRVQTPRQLENKELAKEKFQLLTILQFITYPYPSLIFFFVLCYSYGYSFNMFQLMDHILLLVILQVISGKNMWSAVYIQHYYVVTTLYLLWWVCYLNASADVYLCMTVFIKVKKCIPWDFDFDFEKLLILSHQISCACTTLMTRYPSR